jgi:hypothetical protein
VSHHHEHEPNDLSRLIETEIGKEDQIISLLRDIDREDAPPFLATIKVAMTQGAPMPAVAGPITLTAVGQLVIASVLGFDQNGQPWTGLMPAAILSSDDATGAIVNFDPNTGNTTAVANGVANIKATLSTAEGLALTDVEAVTVAIPVVPPPVPVLSSIKVGFSGSAALQSAFKR